MKFHLAQEFIDKGEKSEPTLCPVALTLRANGFPLARVTTTTAYTGDAQMKYEPLPDYLRRWILDFDSGKPVQPIYFELGDRFMKPSVGLLGGDIEPIWDFVRYLFRLPPRVIKAA